MSGYLALLKRSARRANEYPVYIAGEFSGTEYISGHYQVVKLPRINHKRFMPKPKLLTPKQHIEKARKELEAMLRSKQ